MAGKDLPEGLSSQAAQQRLLEELATLISKSSTLNWRKEIRSNPFNVIWGVFITVAGLLLVLYFAASATERKSAILFQGLLLIFLAAFNIGLFGWEVYIQRTQKVRHLIVRLKPIFDGPCPWSSVDYPRSSVSTLRGHLTTPTYRDGALVNVPISLLVRGDVIELGSGIPSPANAVVLNSQPGAESSHVTIEEVLPQPRAGMRHVAVDEVLPDDMFRESPLPEGVGNSVNFLPEAKPIRLVVTDSPILPLLKSSIQKAWTSNFPTKECAVYIALVASVYLLSLLVNVVRYFALQRDFEDSWPEIILGNPVYTCLPVLFLQLPLAWSFTNIYGTARIAMLVEKGPCFFEAEGLKRIKVFVKTLSAMAKLVFLFDCSPEYRTFHVLGTLTSVCAVDKEFVLTSGFPSPERVFFLRTEVVATEGATGDAGKQHSPRYGGGRGDKDAVFFPETGNFSSPEVRVEVSSHPEISRNLPTPSGGGGSGRSQSAAELVAESHALDTTSNNISPGHSVPLSSLMDTVSTLSTDSAPFELVTEIFNISPDLNSLSGIAFDEVYWQDHIGSLKPIGVNLLTTSHLAKSPLYLSPLGFGSELQLHLHKSSCSCSLSLEIGVADYFSRKFTREVTVHGISDASDLRDARRRSTATTFVSHNNPVQPHLVSSIVRECDSDKALMMSRGSGDMIAACCTDFWDGKDLQPMTVTERASIVDYYNCRSLSSYCIALAYSPLLSADLSCLPSNEIGLFIPASRFERAQECSVSKLKGATGTVRSKAERVFENLQSQVFLGLVCLQFRPKQDVVSLVEDLYATGIRFVHFTAENELRGKIFAQKLGLEADWNCFISLAQPMDGEDSSLYGEDLDEGSDNSSLSSSVLSVFQSTRYNRRARLPKGIRNIRPHIEEVDNVPLLVSLFTDCTAETIAEMIEIMQENSEVVLCLGNAWNHKNIGIFSQADVSLSLVPHYLDLSNCTVTETCGLSASTSSQNASFVHSREKTWPSPLELASYLNATSCQLCFGRNKDISLISLITESRRILSAVRLGLLFGLGSQLTLTLLLLLSAIFFLPPPLSGGHMFWLLVFILPLLISTFLAAPLDPDVRSLMPNKTKGLFSNRWLILVEFIVLFGPTAVVLVTLFGLVLSEICVRDIVNATCHPLLGDRDAAGISPWNGWRGEAEQGLLLAQNVTAFFTTVYLVALSVRYVHRTQPLWKLWRFVSWQYLLVAPAAVALQVVFCVASQLVNQRGLPVVSSGLASVPVSVWVIGFSWPFLAVGMAEVLKYVDKKKLFAAQTLLRLQFGTKLGMHSPV